MVTCGADSLNHMHLAPMHPPHLPLAGHILPSGHFSFAAHFTPPDDGSVVVLLSDVLVISRLEQSTVVPGRLTDRCPQRPEKMKQLGLL